MGDDTTRKEVNGPIDNRGCTDLLCFIIFVGGFVFLVVLACMGFSNGNPVALTSVFDASGKCCGNVCDRYSEMNDYPYLFFPIPTSGFLYDYNVCVKECPTQEEDSTMECYGTNDPTLNANTQTCTDNCPARPSPYFYQQDIYMDANSISGTAETTELQGTFCTYETYLFMDRVCFPESSFFESIGKYSESFSNSLSSTIDTNALQAYVDSITVGWPIILASVFIAMVCGFIYLIYVRLCVGVIIWFSIIAYNLLILALAVICLLKAQSYEDESPPNTDDADNQRIISYILFGCLGVSIIIICCLYSKIKLAIGVLKTAANYVGDVKSALFVSPVFALVTAAYWFLWIIGFVYLFSWGDVVQRTGSVFGEVMWAENVEGYIWFYLFMGLWVNAFIQACCQFVLVSCPCIWYFAQPNTENMHAPVWTSVKRCFRYHLGSLAFGSLLVAIVQMIRIILAYIEQQSKKTGWGDKQPMKCVLKYLQCMAACFERFIKFINKNAYIEIAMQGRNFCSAAKEAIRILWNNAGRATIINGIGGIFIFIGEILIAIGCTLICYLILTNASPFNEYSPFFPCILIFIISYTIGVLFMSVYGNGIDAIFLCFCHDEENARGKGMEAPEHCPEELRSFFKDKVQPKQDLQAAKLNKVQATNN